jgi:hypothetical protein
MMEMTNEINAKLAASIQKSADQIARMECATCCHRGVAIPVTPPLPPPPARAGGTGRSSTGEVAFCLSR